MDIIGIAGRAQAGKSTTAGLLAAAINGLGYTVAIDAFAVGVKHEARRLGWNGVKDAAGRKMLQDIGNGYRIKYGDTHWVNQLVRRWVHVAGKDNAQAMRACRTVDFLIIPDVRYANEAELIRAAGTMLIKGGAGDLTGAAAEHISEQLDLTPHAGEFLLERQPSLEVLAAHVEVLAEGMVTNFRDDGKLRV